MRLTHVLFGAAVLSALFLPACSSEQDPGDFGASSSLSFLVDMEPVQEVGTRALSGSVLLTDDSDATLCVQLETGPAGVTTRASQATLGGIGSVHVTAYDHEGDFGPATISYAGGFGFADVDFTVVSNVGTPSPDRYWPFANRHLSFFAYANAGSGMGASPIALTTGYPSFSYTVPAAASQTDLLVSESLNQVASVTTDLQRGRVPLTFHHALSAVIFSVGTNLGLNSSSAKLTVELTGLNDSGTFQYSATAPTYGAWSGQSGSASYTAVSNRTGATANSDLTDMSGSQVLFLMPQEIPAGARLGITYTDPANVAHTYSATLNTLGIASWSPGYYYKYTVALGNNTLTVGTYPKWTDADTGFLMDGPVTAYTTGDHFGVFAVDGSGKVVLSNVDMTLDASGQLSDGTHFIDKDYTYYVYYPYQSSLSGAPAVGTTVASGASADTFFSGVISAWTVGTTQYTAATFKASDLQVGKATRSGTYFTATLSHKMGLAKITPGSKSVSTGITRTYDNSANTYVETSSGTTTVEATSEIDQIPRLYGSGGIWTIVAPATSLTVTSNPDEPDYWTKTISNSDISQGQSRNYPVYSNRTFNNFEAIFPYSNNTTLSCYSITLPCRGSFKLEVWGASGNTGYGDAGLGGYTYGTYTSNTDDKVLYVCVGGAGNKNTSNAYSDAYSVRGFNGGGAGQEGGGGATHIADALVGSGVLSDYSSSANQNYVLVVAGGAGNADLGIGGHGGGGNSNGTHGMAWTRWEGLPVNGNNRLHTEMLYPATGYGPVYGEGGTASGGGKGLNNTSPGNGSFGLGGYASNSSTDSAAGGGGGWYGGGSSTNGGRGSGGGGSGHIHPSKITDGGGETGRTFSQFANGSSHIIGGTPTGAQANDPVMDQVVTPPSGSHLRAKGLAGYAKITLLSQ